LTWADGGREDEIVQSGSIGSRLLAGGVVVFVAGYVLMILAVAYAGLVAGIGLAGVGLGAAIVCARPQPPLLGRLARVGTGLLAVGAFCLVGSSIIAAGMTFDPLESMPVVILGLAGLLLLPAGLALTVISLVRRITTSRA
jgi:hypothetical protein